MQLPDLSRLALQQASTGQPRQTLWEYLISENVAKEEDCTEVKDMKDKNQNENCAIEGFLMIKDLDNPQNREEEVRYIPNPDDSYIEVDVKSRVKSGDQTVENEVKTTTRRLETISHGSRNLLQGNDVIREWVEKHFGSRCALDKKYVYNHIIKKTEFLYMDGLQIIQAGRSRSEKVPTLDKGFLAMKIYDTEEKKTNDKMPNKGMFEKPYVYIQLVCALESRGFGIELLNTAIAVALANKCYTIALSTLTTPASFYYRNGFKFCSRDGNIVEVDKCYISESEGKERLVHDCVSKDNKRKRSKNDDSENDDSKKIKETPLTPLDFFWSLIRRLSSGSPSVYR